MCQILPKSSDSRFAVLFHIIKNDIVSDVKDLDRELVSNSASYTVTCKYEGNDEFSVSWSIAGKVVSNSDDGIAITAGNLNSETNERYI